MFGDVHWDGSDVKLPSVLGEEVVVLYVRMYVELYPGHLAVLLYVVL